MHQLAVLSTGALVAANSLQPLSNTFRGRGPGDELGFWLEHFQFFDIENLVDFFAYE
jgi:hypothetical protein